MNTDLNSEVSALRNQVFTLLIALIVVSGTLTVYLYRQASIARKDIASVKPQAEQVIGAFNQNQALMNNFFNAVVAYGKTHPEFQPILIKNGIAPNPNAPAPAAPAPAAPKK
jgi:hypothetical protein